MKQSFTILILLLSIQLSAQIFMDGYTYEWSEEQIIIDSDNDAASGTEILELEITDDSEKIYFRIKIEDEINPTEDNNLFLYIDLDNNPFTGQTQGSLGADLIWDFGNNDGTFYAGANSFDLDWPDLSMRVLPTHTASEFEVSIDKNAMVFGNLLFTASEISVLLKDISGLDQVPNSSETFIYSLSNEVLSEFEIDLLKEQEEYVRLLSWNTEFDGPLDSDRKQEFLDILVSMNPEIIAFQETWDMTETEALDFIEEAGYMNWHVDKNEDNNIILSKYPIIESHNILENARLQAVKINLPDPQYQRDLVIINAHLSCCGNDAGRQLQVDAIANFIQQIKTGTGPFSVSGNTPFLICGDMNFVGFGQQLNTLQTGDIINESIFGTEGPMDWNNEDMENLLCYQTDERSAITWRNDFSSFQPGKLDYILFSSSVMDIPKSFVIQTETMSPDRLALYNWNSESTSIASDHFPMVADLDLPYAPVGIEVVQNSFTVFPNPVKNHFEINSESKSTNYSLYDINGIERLNGLFYGSSLPIDSSNLPAGTYILKIGPQSQRILKVK